jgi:hypothetical protein
MGDVVAFKKSKPADKQRGNTLCRHGFHKWELVSAQRFDVKEGKLITVHRCKRCGAVKNKAL